MLIASISVCGGICDYLYNRYCWNFVLNVWLKTGGLGLTTMQQSFQCSRTEPMGKSWFHHRMQFKSRFWHRYGILSYFTIIFIRPSLLHTEKLASWKLNWYFHLEVGHHPKFISVLAPLHLACTSLFFLPSSRFIKPSVSAFFARSSSVKFMAVCLLLLQFLCIGSLQQCRI